MFISTLVSVFAIVQLILYLFVYKLVLIQYFRVRVFVQGCTRLYFVQMFVYRR